MPAACAPGTTGLRPCPQGAPGDVPADDPRRGYFREMDAVSLRRSLVAATALATVLAAVPALVGQQASAAATTNISLSGPTHGAAGACLMYKVTPTDAFGGPATDTGTVVVRLSESPNGDAQDVDFCVPGSVSSPAVSPHYVNASAAKRFY